MRRLYRFIKKSNLFFNLLRALFLALFAFSSYKLSIEVFRYSIEKLNSKGIILENIKIDPGTHFRIEFSAVKYKRQNISFNGEKIEITLNISESIKNLKPVFDDVKVGSFKLFVRDKDRKNRKFEIPDIKKIDFPLKISLKKIKIGKGEINFGKGNLHTNGLTYKNGEFTLEPLVLSFQKNTVKTSKITGKFEQGKVFVNKFTVSLNEGKFSVGGVGDIDLEKATINLSGNWKKYVLALSLKKNLDKVELKGSLSIPEFLERVIFNLKSEISERTVLLSGNLKSDKYKLLSEFTGEIKDRRVDLKGRLKGDFDNGELALHEIDINYLIKGDLFSPDVAIDGKIRKFSVFNENFPDTYISGKFKRLDLLNGTISSMSDKYGRLFIFFNGSLKRKDVSFSGKLDEFSLKGKLLENRLSKKITEWIPEIAGKLTFNGNFNSGKLGDFKVNFLVDTFYFRGFKGKGNITASLVRKGVFAVKGDINGDNGNLYFDGRVDVLDRAIKIDTNIQNFSIASLDFLSAEGLAGIVNAEGIVEGKISNISGNFKFFAPEFSYFDEKFSNIKGNIVFSYPSLFITANSEDGRATVSKVAMNFLPNFSIEIAGTVKKFHLDNVEKILSRYKIENPVKLKGVADGSFDISFRSHEKEPFSMDIDVYRFKGFYKFQDIVSGNATGKGKVSFHKYLTVDLTGVAQDTLLVSIPFKGGNYTLLFKNTELKVSGNDFSLSILDESKVNFKASINVKEKVINSSFKLKGEKKFPSLRTSLSLTGKVKGTFDNFTIPVSGKLEVESEYLTDKYLFSFSGKLNEPDNEGSFLFSSSSGKIQVSVKRKNLNFYGNLKDIVLKFNNGKVLTGLLFFNLSLPEMKLSKLKGNISIPIISLKLNKPDLPEIYSSTGIYAKIGGEKISVYKAGFSFDGGQIEIEDFMANLEKATGKFKGSFDGKKLIKLMELADNVNVISGSIDSSGIFSYNFKSKKLNYSLSITSSKIEMRVKYILARLILTNLSAGIENGKVQYLFAGISAGEGNVVVSGKDVISISAFNIPVGEPGIWRARITGNLKYTGEELKGTVTVSRPVILKLGENKKESIKISLPFNADVVINFSEPLVLRSQLWDIKVLPALKFTVKDSNAVVSGNFFILGGKIRYMGKEFEIDYGSGVIENLLDLKGTLNIASTARINDYYVYMFIRGSFTSPVLYFSSEPPLSREQILSLLITGATPSDMEKSNEIFPVVQVAYYASSFLLKPFEKSFTKILKLESFAVEPYITRYGETVLKLSLAKRIGSRFRIIGYQTTGQDPEFSVGFQYFIGKYKNFYLEYLYSNYYANEYGLGFNVRVDSWEDLRKLRLRK